MSIPEQSGDSFDFCVLFRAYFTGKGATAFFQSDKGKKQLAYWKQEVEGDQMLDITKRISKAMLCSIDLSEKR